ncbi:MAG: 2-oxo-acid dehydrogenase component, homodimeric type [Gammaproteobacteria bacterium]|nr:2-oxo-acid dehydrogenase component, homodimeric type [Gammaproteobacteria bacterium]
MAIDKHDSDALETAEWLAALDSVVENAGHSRAQYLIEQLVKRARLQGADIPYAMTSAYKNTILPENEKPYPGNLDIERRINTLISWNALAMVVRAGKKAPDLGGHIATFASAATLYDVGFNHCFRAADEEHGGDLIFVQGHSSPGIYAREFLHGRFTALQLENFRQEIDKDGLSSYPHPWLMPDFWQFPTVSMGLGALQGIYQARFLKYLHHRGIADTTDRKVWVFCGDGEMDEPESLGAISLASREQLDNLIFVVNCNLQRLDGPVRGNGKIIQELEGVFHGAGWNVLKVIWGNRWDPLLARDKEGILLKRMEEVVDGEYQNYKANSGAYVREHFFGKNEVLAKMAADLSDDDIWHLNRGGHDPQKVYTAYQTAMQHKGQPTVILAKTVKGYGLGEIAESLNIAHNAKKVSPEALLTLRDKFHIPISDEQARDAAFYRPPEHSEEIRYLKERRQALGGALPARRLKVAEKLTVPKLEAFEAVLKGTTEDKHISTTMAFVRILTTLLKDKQIGSRIVPIVPDESRTFGMEGLFRQVGIYSSIGQLYTPVDAKQLMYYREATDGQILEEGINEAGSFCSWMAAASAYSIHNRVMIPFYIYYSMFGFQRTGDLAWAAGDMRARGFLLGGTAGRTTLAGEGLQHQDGHSHILAATIPNCRTYDPTFAYELAVIIQDGLYRMVEKEEDVFYYITVMNENYGHPEMPKGVEEGIIKGLYQFNQVKAKNSQLHIQLMGSGTILREVIHAADVLANDYDVNVTVWSAPSFNELGRDARAVERHNRLHPAAKAKEAYVTTCLSTQKGPVVAATDYMRAYAEQVRTHVPGRYFVLGTDGFGRSDTRTALRQFFEVDYRHIVHAALKTLADEGEITLDIVKKAAENLKIDAKKPDPTTV